MSAWSKYDFQVRQTLGAAISNRNPWMSEMAILSEDYRLLLALLQALEILKPNLDKMRTHKIKMIMQHLGHAEWPRDYITDMGLKLGDTASTHRADEPADNLD